MDTTGNHFHIPDGNNHVIRKLTLNLTVGLDRSESMEFRATVYPNPGSDRITIAYPKSVFSDDLEVRILDAAGKLMLVQSHCEAGTAIDIHSLPEGLYFAHVSSQVLKFIKTVR